LGNNPNQQVERAEEVWEDPEETPALDPIEFPDDIDEFVSQEFTAMGLTHNTDNTPEGDD